METQTETEWKFAHEIVVGDKTTAFGLLSEVTKVDLVFHYVPDSRARIELKLIDTSEKAVLFIPRNVRIEILK